MTEKSWRVVLSSEAEKDFVRILAYTLEIFGPRQAAFYETTILDASPSLTPVPKFPGA